MGSGTRPVQTQLLLTLMIYSFKNYSQFLSFLKNEDNIYILRTFRDVFLVPDPVPAA